MNCPECGKEMEKGMLDVGSRGILYGMRWWINVEKGQSTFGRKSEVLRRMGSDFGTFGSRCPECRIIMLKY